MNYVNYLNHTISRPDSYQRRFDLDLSQEDSGSLQQFKRVALVSLPFISLYRPIGSALSIGMGGTRVLSHISQAIHLQDKKEWSPLIIQIVRISLSSIPLISTIFSFSLGLFITTTTDIGQGVFRASSQAWQGEYGKAFEETLQVAGSVAYLGFMATGAFEVMLISSLIQAATCLYQSRLEIAEGKYLEAAGKIAMAGIRLYQANQYRELIQRRNAIFAMQKYQTLVQQALRGREVRHLVHSSLVDLNGKIDEKQVTLGNQEQSFDFGSHFHGFGKGLVKGANLAFRREIVDGKEQVLLEFKLNHVFRDKLEKTLSDLSKFNPKEMKEILSLTGSHVQGIKMEMVDNGYDDHVTRKIHLEGLGNISIGASSFMINSYDRVVIRMDANKTLYDLHEMLSFTNLDAALYGSTNEDLDRLKMGHLFRTFFPKEATPFERSEEFFTLPMDALKNKMIEKASGMKEVLDQYFDRISVSEILPGKIRYQITGLADKVKELGGLSLTAAVTGAYASDQELYARIASMLSMGMMSQEIRDTYGLTKGGLGGTDWTGGADSVYTQMITAEDVKKGRDLNDFYYSKARMLISLKALEGSSYQYYDDAFGNRIYSKEELGWWYGFSGYATRPNILEFTETLQKPIEKPVDAPWWGDANYNRHEVMLKERLDPSFFTGIILDSEQTRDGLLDYLRGCNLVQKNADGNETILGVLAGQFFRVGHIATDSLVG
jgi:hypothetical protein